MKPIRGLHHITAIAGPAQENLDFYAGVLGMRLVKKSVNQDDPGTYHLFYADAEGHPGTDLTFFPWAQLAPQRDGLRAQHGSVARGAAGQPRLFGASGCKVRRDDSPVETRFGARVLPLVDPHGLRAGFGGKREFVRPAVYAVGAESDPGRASDSRTGERAHAGAAIWQTDVYFLLDGARFSQIRRRGWLAALWPGGGRLRPVSRSSRSCPRTARRVGHRLCSSSRLAHAGRDA